VSLPLQLHHPGHNISTVQIDPVTALTPSKDTSRGFFAEKAGRWCRAPDTAPTKAKMQHASTKDLFRGLLEGVSVELHATDAGDLAETIVKERVANTVARK
jgi:Cofilin/tropomyosin-type actin-binding protein